MMRATHNLLAVLAFSFCTFAVSAAELRVAVASNFAAPLQSLSRLFELQTAHKVVAISGSSGKHFAQIINGAPIDILLAADQSRPQQLALKGHALKQSRFTYAIGKLVLWSPQPNWFNNSDVLSSGQFRFLAIANPKFAPYGAAAASVLDGLQLYEPLKSRMVRGENISQTFHFISSGNAQLGFVALSQLRDKPHGSRWLVPQNLYSPIEQQAVIIRDSPAAKSFMDFLKSAEAIAAIQAAGYDTP